MTFAGGGEKASKKKIEKKKYINFNLDLEMSSSNSLSHGCFLGMMWYWCVCVWS